MGPEIIKINQNTWSINEEGVRFFLLTGEKEALLIDSGMMTHNAKEIAQQLTELPIRLLNTHADGDHIGSNAEFAEFYMNPAEAGNYYKHNNGTGTIIPVEDKDVLDLGSRKLEIVALPGHTPGSIGILDVETGDFFSGDPIQDGNIFMFGDAREMHAYMISLKKVWDMKERITAVYPSHGTCPIKTDIIPGLLFGAEKVLKGEIEGQPMQIFGHEIVRYDVGVAGFFYDKQE